MKNSNSFPTEFYLMRQVGIGTMPLSLFLTHALLTTREIRRRQKKVTPHTYRENYVFLARLLKKTQLKMKDILPFVAGRDGARDRKEEHTHTLGCC